MVSGDMKPNFKAMSRQELRACMLARRDDDEAFYAYMDKKYEAEAAIYSAVLEWLKLQHQNHEVMKKDKPSEFVVVDVNGFDKLIKVQLMMASLPTYKPFIHDLIEHPVVGSHTQLDNSVMVFVSKTETSALNLERLMEVFNNRTKFSRFVGYVENGRFQNI